MTNGCGCKIVTKKQLSQMQRRAVVRGQLQVCRLLDDKGYREASACVRSMMEQTREKIYE